MKKIFISQSMKGKTNEEISLNISKSEIVRKGIEKQYDKLKNRYCSPTKVCNIYL